MPDIAKAAKSEYDKEYRIKNKDKRSLQNKEWYLKTRKQRFIENPEMYLWSVAKVRAKQKCIEFNIKPDDIIIPELCPISGNKLLKGDGYHPDAMSLDRVDNSLGYIKGNVRVISRSMNLKKSDLSIEILQRLIMYIKGEI